MKIHLTAGYGIVLLGIASGFASDQKSLAFRGERIGIPSLSLSESMRVAATIPRLFPFGAMSPENSGNLESPRSFTLIPPTLPKMLRLSPQRPSRSPHVSRDSGMPILIPGDAVDYKMTIIPPDPKIDFKLVIKDPGPVLKMNESR